LNAAATKKNRRSYVEMPQDDAIGDSFFSWISAKLSPERVLSGSASKFRKRLRQFRNPRLQVHPRRVPTNCRNLPKYLPRQYAEDRPSVANGDWKVRFDERRGAEIRNLVVTNE
jgi:hypothetical protein